MTDQEFMGMARQIAKASTDRSTQVGCVIVGADVAIRTAGCNGFPHGVNTADDTRHERPEKYRWIEHAERNAIYAAARRGVSLSGCRCYLPWFPCMDCARALIQCGIAELIAIPPNLDDPKWGEDFRRVSVMLAEAGVAVRFMEDAP